MDENGRPTQISGSIEEGDDPIVLMQNLDVALTMFKAAAKAGHVDAAFHAALMYMEAEPFTIGHCKVMLLALLFSSYQRLPLIFSVLWFVVRKPF